MSGPGFSDAQNAGRSGRPNNRQRLASSSCTQRTPARLPCGMPGIGEWIDGAMQHAPQPPRQENVALMRASLAGWASPGAAVKVGAGNLRKPRMPRPQELRQDGRNAIATPPAQVSG